MKESKYAVLVQGSFVQDVHLRGGTKNGTYWASYVPGDDVEQEHDIWVTNSEKHVRGLAMLVDGEAVKITFKEHDEGD